MPASDPIPALQRALDDLALSVAFRLKRGPAGYPPLRRDVGAILERAKRAGLITRWLVEVGPVPDDPASTRVEARVTLPDRVERVIVAVVDAG